MHGVLNITTLSRLCFEQSGFLSLTTASWFVIVLNTLSTLAVALSTKDFKTVDNDGLHAYLERKLFILQRLGKSHLQGIRNCCFLLILVIEKGKAPVEITLNSWQCFNLYKSNLSHFLSLNYFIEGKFSSSSSKLHSRWQGCCLCKVSEGYHQVQYYRATMCAK